MVYRAIRENSPRYLLVAHTHAAAPGPQSQLRRKPAHHHGHGVSSAAPHSSTRPTAIGHRRPPSGRSSTRAAQHDEQTAATESKFAGLMMPAVTASAPPGRYKRHALITLTYPHRDPASGSARRRRGISCVWRCTHAHLILKLELGGARVGRARGARGASGTCAGYVLRSMLTRLIVQPDAGAHTLSCAGAVLSGLHVNPVACSGSCGWSGGP
ncbi:hypothetical protein C2E23DRAFT_42071 [Lenzites betulinus]|nr:hypothetical protein C2E23DRAFT_42071 [Lenzites betulinus]